jgi:hypothetical protein
MSTMTRAFAWLGVFVFVSLGLAAGANGASAHVVSTNPVVLISGEYHPIRNVGNGKCLQPQAGGTLIAQFICNGSSEQGWLALNDGGTVYRFVNGSGGGCMSVNNTPVNGGPVQLDNCTLSDGSGRSVSNAQWNFGTLTPSVNPLRTRVRGIDNNFCLDVPGASTAEGQTMQLFACNGTFAQRWIVGN